MKQGTKWALFMKAKTQLKKKLWQSLLGCLPTFRLKNYRSVIRKPVLLLKPFEIANCSIIFFISVYSEFHRIRRNLIGSLWRLDMIINANEMTDGRMVSKSQSSLPRFVEKLERTVSQECLPRLKSNFFPWASISRLKPFSNLSTNSLGYCKSE
jgi:hypothetical protein